MCAPCKPARAAVRASRAAGRTIYGTPLFGALRGRAEERRLIRQERLALQETTGRSLDALQDRLWQTWDDHVQHRQEETRDA